MMLDRMMPYLGPMVLVSNFAIIFLCLRPKRSMRFTMGVLAACAVAVHCLVVFVISGFSPLERFSGLLFTPVMLLLFEGQTFQKLFAIFMPYQIGALTTHLSDAIVGAAIGYDSPDATLYSSTTKTIDDPIAGCNTDNSRFVQGFDHNPELIEELVERTKHNIFEATLADFLPHLFDGVHFRRMRRNKKLADILWYLQLWGSMPSRLVTAYYNVIIGEFVRNFFKEIRIDFIVVFVIYVKEVFSGFRDDQAINRPEFPMPLVWHARALLRRRPAARSIKNSSK